MAGALEMALGWHAAATKPSQEDRAARNLSTMYQVFSPRVRVRADKPDGGVRYVIKPYFRGYVLVRFDSSRDWWPRVNNTRGVLRLVMRGEDPAQVRPGVVEEMRRRMNGSSFIEDEREMDEAILSPGDLARITAGSFAGFTGTVSDVERAHIRIGVLLELFGRKTRIEFPAESVRKIQ